MVEYSFVIPHYNAPNLLERCINSIPSRPDIEIIIIDDNSDDNNKPLFTRDDIKIILLDANHSKGAGHARNVGIEQACGKWLIFVDCDDYLSNNAIQKLDKFKDSVDDIIFFKIDAVNSETLEHIDRCLVFNNYIDNFIRGKFLSEGTLRYIQGVPWGKMIRRELVEKKNIRFEEVRYGNDIMFSLYCGYYAKSIACSNDVLYVVTQREGSLVTQVSSESIECRYQVSMRRVKFLAEKKRYAYIGKCSPKVKLLDGVQDNLLLGQLYNYAKNMGFSKPKLLFFDGLGVFYGAMRYICAKI